ncbi:hypothetical protein HYFRA_00000446 [Hymenoscyphus fraxineus]|uniref:DUF1279 domain-containing protein n=1 Tax=Hymenoscyphus fraxineus TaxID=746836 RepID=A0A9N9PSJ6_9HELO|nr:hypothetical protein HYFRA_00000446 [Hymenoscyphus fraxineus]
MLRSTINSLGARGASQMMRPILRTSPLTTTIPIRYLAQRTITSRPVTPPKSKPGTGFIFSSSSRAKPLSGQTILQRIRSSIRSLHSSRRGRNSKPTESNSSSKATPEPEPTSLGGRLRKLSREYGWSAVGVYFALSAADFPFCYMLVLYVGTDRIGEWEHAFLSTIKRLIPESVKQSWHEWRAGMKNAEAEISGASKVDQTVAMASWGVEEAEAKNKQDASLATRLALAYAIHKSFIFLRVPLTVAVTPKVVRVLRGWGWDIGKRTTKEVKAMRRAHRKLPKAKKL